MCSSSIISQAQILSTVLQTHPKHFKLLSRKPLPPPPPPPPPRMRSRLLRCDPPMHAFYCEVNQSRMCRSSIISQARKLSTVSSNRLLCINSLYYYATILLSLIECGKHIILSAECKRVLAIASDDNINN